ncbi:hypothetical protein [Nocardia sp. NRRL S-836]|uniref:hypothetical protein n=1 Tax=Nocardia sp. NRRL S-836 TaxID=1519492 RepID=UPI0006AFED45|nr:hypothetical protein [Nocardia sp. NRRL S-836]KOV87231.1 hypothetical protein ADL03_07795 [Nocardia sp. NRRL S-836]
MVDGIKGHATYMGAAADHQDGTNADMAAVRSSIEEVSLAAQAVWGGQAKLAFARLTEFTDAQQATNHADGQDIADQTRNAQTNYITGDADSADLLKILLHNTPQSV